MRFWPFKKAKKAHESEVKHLELVKRRQNKVELELRALAVQARHRRR